MKKVLLSLFLLCRIEASWIGHEYAKHSSVQLSHAEMLFQNLNFRGDETILDVGCGNGKATHALAKLAPYGKVIGIDPSLSMLQEAKTHEYLSHLQFLEGRAEDFFFKERFDCIFAIHVMQWVSRKKLLKISIII